MNLRKELLSKNSVEHVTGLARSVIDDQRAIAALVTMMLSNEHRTGQRAAHVLSKCADLNPKALEPYMDQVIHHLCHQELGVAAKRNSLRILQFMDIPENHWGSMADLCFNILLSSEEPIAVKVFAMTNLHHICEHLPELQHELRIILEDQLPYGSAGFRSRASKILKKLN